MSGGLFFQVGIVFAGLCFSTWYFLPYAFYDRSDDANKKRLRDSQIYLFSAGIQFLLYITIEAFSALPNTNKIVSLVLVLARSTLFLTGLVTMVSGFRKAAYVVNRFADIRGGERKILERSAVPFVILNGVMMAFLWLLFFPAIIQFHSPISISMFTTFAGFTVAFALSARRIDRIVEIFEAVTFGRVIELVFLFGPLILFLLLAYAGIIVSRS